MGEGEEEYNEIRPQDDCRPPPPLLLRERGDGRKEERGLSKRHNKIIYVVRNAAERRASGVRRERRGEEGECQCERARANLCRSNANTKAGTVTTTQRFLKSGCVVKIIRNSLIEVTFASLTDNFSLNFNDTKRHV